MKHHNLNIKYNNIKNIYNKKYNVNIINKKYYNNKYDNVQNAITRIENTIILTIYDHYHVAPSAKISLYITKNISNKKYNNISYKKYKNINNKYNNIIAINNSKYNDVSNNKYNNINNINNQKIQLSSLNL